MPTRILPICIVCRERQATIPDRNDGPGARRKKLCHECHVERLASDFATLLPPSPSHKGDSHA